MRYWLRKVLWKLLGIVEEQWPGFEAVPTGKLLSEKYAFWLNMNAWLKQDATRAYFLLFEDRYKTLHGTLLDIGHGPLQHGQILEIRGQMREAEKQMEFPAFIARKVKELEVLIVEEGQHQSRSGSDA